MAQINTLECLGDSHFGGAVNKIDGSLILEGGRVYPLTEIYPIDSVVSSTSTSLYGSALYNIGTWTRLGSLTIGSTTVYFFKRTA